MYVYMICLATKQLFYEHGYHFVVEICFTLWGIRPIFGITKLVGLILLLLFTFGVTLIHANWYKTYAVGTKKLMFV